jgi:hypothetical protein
MLKNTIFKSKNLVYIHIPKTAGNSIKQAIGGSEGDSHASIAEFNKNYKSYNFAAFVRNPWERCFSAFYYLLKGGAQNELDLMYKKKYIDTCKTFEDFILKGNLVKARSECLHFRTQLSFISNGIHPLNFLGKVEHITTDFYLMCQKFQIIPDHNLNKINQSFKPEYIDFFSNEMKNRLYDLYMDDCNVLGYQFHGSRFNPQSAHPLVRSK